MKRRNINLKEMAHTLGQVLRYMLKNYKGSFCVVVVCTLVSALCTLSGTLFLQSLIDDYILPLTQSAAPDFGPLGWALAQMACVYALGILSSYGYNRIMVNISQGTMRNLRDDLFTHMESLPIQYFDTHAHGDIMSVYTNDVDTLRQVISQTIPQMINSLVTMVITLVSLFVLDVPLTLLTIAMLCVMLFVSSKIAGRSAVYFAKQQKDLGAVNGYIEEMMAGQKVVKVFCHEEKKPGGLPPAEPIPAGQRRQGQHLRQHRHAGQRQPGQHQLCAVRRGGGSAGPLRPQRPDFGHPGGLFELEQERHPARQPNQPADQQHRHGHGRRPACL